MRREATASTARRLHQGLLYPGDDFKVAWAAKPDDTLQGQSPSESHSRLIRGRPVDL